MPGEALYVYDGNMYKILRRYINMMQNIDVYILSFKKGLINIHDKIEPYEFNPKIDDILSKLDELDYKFSKILNDDIDELCLRLSGKVVEIILPIIRRYYSGKITIIEGTFQTMNLKTEEWIKEHIETKTIFDY